MKINIALGVLALSSGSLMAQTTTWFGVNDNSAAATGTASDDFTAISSANWHDSMLIEAVPGTPRGSDVGIQVSPAFTSIFSPVGNSQRFAAAFRFDHTFLSDGAPLEDVLQSASFNFYVEAGTFPAADPNYYITPIASGAGAWTESTATWNSLLASINMNDTSTSFAVTGPGWVSIDVTSLLENYLAGTIAGFALVNSDTPTGNEGFNGADDPNFEMRSSEGIATLTPGLSVTVVPEPSSALFVAFGALALLRRRRA